MSDLEIDYQAIEFFVSKVDVKVDVLAFFANKDGKKEKIVQQRDLTISLESKISAPDNFENMLLCEVHMKGHAEDGIISFSGIVTGVFFVKNLSTILGNETSKDLLSKQTSRDVFPYMRELVADIGRRLPITNIIRIPASFEMEISSSSPKAKKSTQSGKKNDLQDKKSDGNT